MTSGIFRGGLSPEFCGVRSQIFREAWVSDFAWLFTGKAARAEVMRLRGPTVEHPFATIKYRIFGHPRFLLRGTGGAQTEISLATMVYNLKRMLNVLGGSQLRDALAA